MQNLIYIPVIVVIVMFINLAYKVITTPIPKEDLEVKEKLKKIGEEIYAFSNEINKK